MIANNLDDFPQGPATQNPGRFRLFPQGFNINKRKNWNLSNKNYVLPTDNDEIFRLNFQHHILSREDGSNWWKLRSSSNCVLLLLATTRAKGMDIEYATEVEYFLSYNGLRYIESDYVSCPIGWNGRVGDLLLQNMMMVLNALKPQIFPAMGISEKEYTESLASMRDEFGKNKTWTKVPYAYGMKPPLPT
ncbi:hypothetical protein BC938DRAFT_483847 [Jimgerdemannia flammicorona]|uniref:Uncharacterized protein n=1 Tax=Jimgerdemannia flammicorona TaxID=994334 RepID=A0A433QB89_9FUNG|nr:hypothetical protein BC938DRAFT_483847 [Jimgerdemannia flammicorona]